ncbi:MAG: hypothetical protein ACK46J_01555, partial [Burkholderiales bacterium]
MSNMLLAGLVSPNPTGGETSTPKFPPPAVAGMVSGMSNVCAAPTATAPVVQVITVPVTPLTVPAPLFTHPAGRVPMVKPTGI